MKNTYAYYAVVVGANLSLKEATQLRVIKCARDTSRRYVDPQARTRDPQLVARGRITLMRPPLVKE